MLEDSIGYREIVAIGIEQGICMVAGEAFGKRFFKAMIDTNQRCITKLVRHRLGQVPEALPARLEALHYAELELLFEQLLETPDPAAVEAALKLEGS
jgi:hypothetical protein